MTDYYTDADHIRDTLDKYGPLTRAELDDKTNLPRETLAKSLYALKKQGDVIEEGDRLMLTKATETAQDAPEEAETGIGSTPAVERVTGKDERHVDIAIEAGSAVSILSEAYWAAINELSELRKDNEKLRDELTSRNVQWDKMVRYHDAYHALKEKLRGMLDD